jgi:hypothetical protein
MAELIKRFLSRYEVFIMFDVSKENLSLGEFLTKNFPSDYPLCIVSEMIYLGEDYVKDWDECFCGSVHEFMNDASKECKLLRSHRNFIFEFDDVDNETLIIIVIDFYPDGE